MGIEALTIRAATSSEVLPFVMSASRFDTAVNGINAEKLIGECDAFVLQQNGNDVAGFLLRRKGKEIYVVAAAGRSNIDLSIAINKIITDTKSDDIESISFTTKRRGLVKKAEKQGYKIEGYILRKRINNG